MDARVMMKLPWRYRKCFLACLCANVLLMSFLSMGLVYMTSPFVDFLDFSVVVPEMKIEIFPNWTTKNPNDPFFTRRLYLYSAIIALHKAPTWGSAVHFVAFQDGRHPLTLNCCARHPHSDQIYTGQRATLDFSLQSVSPKHSPFDLRTIGVVYRCWFPFSPKQLREGYATLSPTSCPAEVEEYQAVHYPEVRPGGLAICAKIAYGFRLNHNKLVEWFEMQRLLGVDKIQLFDLNNTVTVYKIFRHYQDMGLLELLPYKLPGRPWGRFILERGKDYARFGDDEELIIWDCRLRLAGFDYVMDIDMDEVILPRRYKALKPFFKEEFARYPKAASLHFKIQLFLENWGPVDPGAPLLFLRYLNSTYSPGRTGKHVYLPPRTHQAITHEIRPYSGYEIIKFIPTSVATMFHYRTCKKNWWFSCNGPRTTDRSMQRFQEDLVPAVQSVQDVLGLDPLSA